MAPDLAAVPKGTSSDHFGLLFHEVLSRHCPLPPQAFPQVPGRCHWMPNSMPITMPTAAELLLFQMLLCQLLLWQLQRPKLMVPLHPRR